MIFVTWFSCYNGGSISFHSMCMYRIGSSGHVLKYDLHFLPHIAMNHRALDQIREKRQISTQLKINSLS